MTAAETIQLYQQVQQNLKRLSLPAIKPAPYVLEFSKPEVISCKHREEVDEKIHSFKPASGWLSCQSGNLWFKKNDDVAFNPDYGQLLSAEVARPNGSMRVRWNGRDGWLLTEYIYRTANDTDTDENVIYLVDKVTHIATHPELEKLNYLRFWQQTDIEPGLSPVHACFTGFAEEN